MDTREKIFTNQELHKLLTDALVRFAASMNACNAAYIEAINEINKNFNEQIATIREAVGNEADETILQ